MVVQDSGVFCVPLVYFAEYICKFHFLIVSNAAWNVPPLMLTAFRVRICMILK